MAGTILKTLGQIAISTPADNTVATAANTGFVPTGFALTTNGNTCVFLDAAKMGGSAGIKLTQSGAVGIPAAYMDLDASVSVFSFRIPFNSDAPLLQARAFLGADHTTTLWTVTFTAGGKLQFVEGTPGANVTASGSIPNNADCILMGLVDAAANTFTVRAYQRGSGTVYSEVTGVLSGSAASVSARTFRIGFGTNNVASGSRVYLNNNTAIGSGDFLARTDLAAAVPTAGASQYVQAGTQVSFSDASATGSPTSIAWACTATPAGVTAPTITNPSTLTSAKATLTSPGVYEFTLTVDGSTSKVLEYVYPASNADVAVRSVTLNSWTAVGGTAAAILNTPGAGKYLETPSNPAGAKCVVLLNPLGPGNITVSVSGYDVAGSISRKIDVCRVDGTTVVYSLPAFPAPDIDTAQLVTLDATALAAVSSLAQRAELTVVITDTLVP